MDFLFPIETLSSGHKPFSLSSKLKATLQKENVSPTETATLKEIKHASIAMEKAEEAFNKMYEIRAEIEAKYLDLLTFFP